MMYQIHDAQTLLPGLTLGSRRPKELRHKEWRKWSVAPRELGELRACPSIATIGAGPREWKAMANVILPLPGTASAALHLTQRPPTVRMPTAHLAALRRTAVRTQVPLTM